MNNLVEHLHQNKILVTQEWLIQCVQYIRSEIQPEESRLILELQKQWLNSDISTPGVMLRSVFPDNVADMASFTFNCTANLQVNYGVDIGNSSYSQLQKIHKLENENTRVSADTSDDTQSQYQPSQGQFVSTWEPKASRMLKLSITDGVQTLEAFEHEQIACLGNKITPGLKIQVHGPLEVKRGKMFLKEGHVIVLGGEVEHLSEKFSQENVLSQRIGKRVDGPLYQFMKGIVSPNNLASHPGSSQQQRQLATFSQQQSNPSSSQRVPGNNLPDNGSRSPNIDIYNDVILGDDEIDWDDDDFPDDDDDFLPLVETASIPSNRRASNDQEGNKRSPLRENFALACNNQTDRENTVSQSNSSYVVKQSKPKSVVRPLDRNGVEVTKKPKLLEEMQPSKSFAAGPKKSIQTSMSSFLSKKISLQEQEYNPPPSTSTALPITDNFVSNFELNDDLLEYSDEDDIPLASAVRPSQEVPNDPFVYLSEIKKELEKNPDRCLDVSVKAVSTTLVNGIKVVKSPSGQQWLICVVINDGSDAIQAEMRGEIIAKELGEAEEYAAAKQGSDKISLNLIKQRISELSQKLAALNSIIKLRLNGRDGVASIVEINELKSYHLAKLRRRKLR